jgi:hypothetical protein
LLCSQFVKCAEFIQKHTLSGTQQQPTIRIIIGNVQEWATMGDILQDVLPHASQAILDWRSLKDDALKR